MNNKLKLDTTMLQSNTAMHLIAYMTQQRNMILELVKLFDNAGIKITEKEIIKELRELSEDFEYISKKHTHALHKRCGRNIYPRKEDSIYDNAKDDLLKDLDELYESINSNLKDK